MLKEKTVPVDHLLLDPNNPRFVKTLRLSSRVSDDKLEEKQEATLRLFEMSRPQGDDEVDATNIGDLYESMTTIGFVPIDHIVIRPVKGSDKYLVIEGNRRVSTAKLILNDYETGAIKKPSDRRRIEPLLASLRSITCMLLDTEGMSQDDVDHKVSVILGLRHHGSLLEWEPLPSAYNIYNEYMSEEPKSNEFELGNNTKIRSVAGRLSIPTSKVRQALRTYIAYLQLRARFPDVRPYHFSLIEAGVTDKYLAVSYFRIDGRTFQLDEDSLSKMDMICQFATRDAKPEGKKKIVPDPKKFRLLGRLVDKRQRADHEVTKQYADDLIRRVEDENDLEMTIDRAVDDLTAFEGRKKWVEVVTKLLDKQAKELPLEDYTGLGNDSGQKDELKATLAKLRKVTEV